ncbi:zinc-dependent alcohol dehydrogenase [Actinoalloteichus hymeniacidonis]|uniref:Theronine dehydrogenase-like Zn-dependent dehydrogenase n=1 Tax=Actinoalloteichus hymeniacidonis TaxID=340345 RepID=A0AAC9HSY2_9PSEU|nr:zinc-dependent alcohol dehydrogenase [Actinoalloteichus hymeniacidonis]AOS64780.1 theronine dehydrogenase-like Zn-dependent dehydrogenase [Actinoalloteichus hymeniacidonis]MBB5907144.1 threonine dehydrogenase-like Zn-dependent dehydrogenase [Actinoalloteichus hymeniacidonis]
MKAVVWHGTGDIRLDEVPEPKIEEPTDAIVRVTRSAICGTDLHMVRGTLPGMVPGTVLGHEAVGVVEATGSAVRGFTKGDRVVVCSTIGCGACSYCRAGYYAQCDVANPNGPGAGTSFFGGPKGTGPVHGLQADYARVPYAATTLVRVPDSVTDDEAILVSDIFPTAWFGGRLAEIGSGDTVLVLGAGVVGQFAIVAAKLQGAGRVLVVDGEDTRLAMARRQNAETIDFNSEDPVATVRELTRGIGVDRVIEAVGVDAQRPTSGPAAAELDQLAEEFERERHQAAPHAHPQEGQWVPGDAPSLAARWAVSAVAKAGTIGVIGVYPPGFTTFPFGEAMNKNLTISMGNCNHRRYVPQLLDLVAAGTVTPSAFITQQVAPASAIEAYQTFDRRQENWLKTVLTVS